MAREIDKVEEKRIWNKWYCKSPDLKPNEAIFMLNKIVHILLDEQPDLFDKVWDKINK